MEHDFWLEIIASKYQCPKGHALLELTEELLSYLALPDPELRDTFAYDIMARWILVYGYYTPQDLRAMMDWLLPRMAYGLGERDTDSVFLRSYAALVLSLIAYRDNQINFMTQVEMLTLADRARHYLLAEQDLRAYVPGKGWANACAHTADLLKFIARSGHLDKPDLMRLLDAVADKLLTNTDCMHQHDEDDRLAHVVLAVLRRDMLGLFDLTDWLRRFTLWKSGQERPDDFDSAWHVVYQNSKHFLRSVYLQMQLAPRLPADVEDFEPELLAALRLFSL